MECCSSPSLHSSPGFSASPTTGVCRSAASHTSDAAATRARETNRSARTSDGVCTNYWPNGNTLSDFVTIYR